MDKGSEELKVAASSRVPGRAGFDYLVVGAGFAGSVLAERLATQLGQRVLRRRQAAAHRRQRLRPLRRRRRPDPSLRAAHLPHQLGRDLRPTCRSSPSGGPYQHRVLASVDGQLVPMPINLDTVNRLYGLQPHVVRDRGLAGRSVAEKRSPVIRTSEDVVVGRVGRELYNKFFRGYTRKQWGLDPSELDASRHRARADAHQPRRPLLRRHASRPCRCTATRGCSRRCSPIRTSR